MNACIRSPLHVLGVCIPLDTFAARPKLDTTSLPPLPSPSNSSHICQHTRSFSFTRLSHMYPIRPSGTFTARPNLCTISLPPLPSPSNSNYICKHAHSFSFTRLSYMYSIRPSTRSQHTPTYTLPLFHLFPHPTSLPSLPSPSNSNHSRERTQPFPFSLTPLLFAHLVHSVL